VSHFAHLDAVSWVTGVLGAFLAFQANRVRFLFDEDALEVGAGVKAVNEGMLSLWLWG
jgi:hypothetical protein